MHELVLVVCTHNPEALQTSSVHTLLSSQFTATPRQCPPEQVSPAVHALPSLHDFVLFMCTHAPLTSQLSSVHTLLSSQFTAKPTHCPPEQESPVVHAFPSLHEFLLFVCTHTPEVLQVSSVHTLLSSQFSAVPLLHVPPEQVSPIVHAFPSLHERALLVCAHPVAGEHASVVHRFPSSQLSAAPPTHAPPEQASPVVHAFPSLHGVVFG